MDEITSLKAEIDRLTAERDNMAKVIAQLLKDNTDLQNKVVMPLRERVAVLERTLKGIRNEAEVFGGGFAEWLLQNIDAALKGER